MSRKAIADVWQQVLDEVPDKESAMRVLFIVVAAVSAFLAGACGARSYIDLRKPIYFVTEDSFFVDCDKDPLGESFCRDSRRQKVRDGVAQWLNHFEDNVHPVVRIVKNGSDVPFGSANDPIRLSVQKGGCDEKPPKNFLACYNNGGFMSDPRIIFTAAMPENIAYYVVAHEFGHALGLDHYDNADKSSSIMSASVPIGGTVVSTDIDRLCQIHKECPKRKSVKKGGKGKK